MDATRLTTVCLGVATLWFMLLIAREAFPAWPAWRQALVGFGVGTLMMGLGVALALFL